jgi:hypothetical protein
MPRVAACEFLHGLETGGKLDGKALHDLVLWVTGSRAKAEEAGSRRAAWRQAHPESGDDEKAL